MDDKTSKKIIKAAAPLGAEGHRERMLERFLQNGDRFIEDHRLLEMLLYAPISRADTRDRAVTLLKEFGSIEGVLDAEKSALIRVHGIGNKTADFIKLVGAICDRCDSGSSDDKTEYLHHEQVGLLLSTHIGRATREYVCMAAFDSDHRLLKITTREMTADEYYRAPLDGVVDFISDTGARYFALAHNHENTACDIDSAIETIKLLRRLNVGSLGFFYVNGDCRRPYDPI